MSSMCPTDINICCNSEEDSDDKVLYDYINTKPIYSPQKFVGRSNKIVSPSIQSSSETSYNSRISLKKGYVKPFSPIQKLNYLQ